MSVDLARPEGSSEPLIEWAQSRTTLTVSFMVEGARDVALLVAREDSRTITFRGSDADGTPYYTRLKLWHPVFENTLRPEVLRKCVRIVMTKLLRREWTQLTDCPPRDVRSVVSYNWDLHVDDFEDEPTDTSSDDDLGLGEDDCTEKAPGATCTDCKDDGAKSSDKGAVDAAPRKQPPPAKRRRRFYTSNELYISVAVGAVLAFVLALFVSHVLLK